MGVELKWLKRKDGSIYSIRKKLTYRISVRGAYFLGNMVKIARLTANEQPIQEVDYVIYCRYLFGPELTEEQLSENEKRHKVVKTSLKEHAALHANGKIKPPKPVPFDKEAFQKRMKREMRQARKEKLESLLKVVTEEPSFKRPIIGETYDGELPEQRFGEGLLRIDTPVRSNPCPFLPEDAKFSTLFKWIEKIRDYFEIRGMFPTLHWLHYAVCYGFSKKSDDNIKVWDHDRGQKAMKRVSLLLPDEARNAKAYHAAWIEKMNSLPPPEDPTDKKKKTKQTKDKWGFKETSESAKINAVVTKVPKTAKQIKTEAKVGRDVSSHLGTLVRRKLIKKTSDGKYRLRKSAKKTPK